MKTNNVSDWKVTAEALIPASVHSHFCTLMFNDLIILNSRSFSSYRIVLARGKEQRCLQMSDKTPPSWLFF